MLLTVFRGCTGNCWLGCSKRFTRQILWAFVDLRYIHKVNTRIIIKMSYFLINYLLSTSDSSPISESLSRRLYKLLKNLKISDHVSKMSKLSGKATLLIGARINTIVHRQYNVTVQSDNGWLYCKRPFHCIKFQIWIIHSIVILQYIHAILSCGCVNVCSLWPFITKSRKLFIYLKEYAFQLTRYRRLQWKILWRLLLPCISDKRFI